MEWSETSTDSTSLAPHHLVGETGLKDPHQSSVHEMPRNGALPQLGASGSRGGKAERTHPFTFAVTPLTNH